MKSVTESPTIDQVVIAYRPDGSFYFSRYSKVLTWKGYKLKFVNLLSKGLWFEDVVGWNKIPNRDSTID